MSSTSRAGLTALDYVLGVNDVAIQIPEQIAVGSTEFIWQDLLGMP